MILRVVKRPAFNRFFSVSHKFEQNKNKMVVSTTDSLDLMRELEKIIPETQKTADNLFVHEEGHGDNHVILLHSLGSTYKYWIPLLSQLNNKKFKYLVPDLLGHGRSPHPKHLSYDIDTHLYYIYRDIFDVFSRTLSTNTSNSKISKTPVHLIGHGLGAIFALEIASRTPHLVKHLTLISFPYFQDPISQKEQIKNLFNPSNHIILTNRLLCNISCNISRYNYWWLKYTLPLVTSKPAWILEDSMKYSTSTSIYRTFRNCILNYDPNSAASSLVNHNLAINLIHGSDDETVPFNNVESFFAKFPEFCQLDEVKGAGHDLALFNTADLAEHLNKNILDE
eukprot:TRINITY_DN957_c0_g1_i10.p1 TRINITY_DN957_c0_g1~~TRINITY_DN957_c0_g1_i10.p1  ORF type:complete len:338 (+),score=8.69 TRINITY_DN957_c0_g1_i10:2-1015(+)